MNDTQTPEFKMRLDGETPESGFQQEVDDLRISKLSQRVTLISILIPCLFLAIVLFLYIDAKKEVTATFHTGSKEIQSLSQKIEFQFSEMMVKNQQREEEFKQKIDALEKTLGELTKKVDENSKTMKRIDESKASKTSVSSSVTKLNTTLDSLNAEFESLSNEIKTLGKNLAGETASLKENLNSQNKKMEILQVNQSNLRKELQGVISDHKKSIQKEIEDRLASIQQRINMLEGEKPSAELPAQNTQNKTNPPQSTRLPEAPPPREPSQKSGPAPRGTIIEQDVQ